VALFLAVYPLVNQTPKPTQAESINKAAVVVKQEPVAKPSSEPVPQKQPEAPKPPVTPAPTPQPQPPVVYHSDDFYKEFIFSHESSNRLNAVNSIGCYGLGQSCSDSLRNECPNWATDLNCQLAFWDRYAVRRYGSWANAYNFWLSHKWW